MSFRFNLFGSNQSSRDFKKPVGWLLGQQLLAALKWIAIYAAYGTKLDFRDWMQGQVSSYRDWAQDPAKKNWPEDEPFWFDYIADTGDGQRATYSIAYLCQGDLYLAQENSLPGPEQVSLQHGSYLLPRGQFLFVGGDTAYHIADFPTLAERFQKPFNWAYDDRLKSGSKDDDSVRPIFAIPANHDYYDFLDGFNRQFRAPLPSRTPFLNPDLGPPLDLKGFKRLQIASYVALHLPFDWWLLGIDTQNEKTDRIDKRQQAFFHAILHPEDGNKPHKLIIATPEPSTRFGQWATREGDKRKLVEVFENQLKLPPCFLEEQQGRLPTTQCRLDISGDIHHYARYWGTGCDNAEASSRTNYASVVAGGGGAFLHPSHINTNQVAHNALYPEQEDSHRTMMQQLLNPYNIARGGFIWLAGAIAAFIVYFAATIAQSSWSVFHLIPDDQRPCGGKACGDALLERIQAALSIAQDGVFVWFSQPTAELIYAIALTIFLLWQWMFRLNGLEKIQKDADSEAWLRATRQFLLPCLLTGLPLLFFVFLSSASLPSAFAASSTILAFTTSSILGLAIAGRFTELTAERVKYGHATTLLDRFIAGSFIFFAITGLGYGLLRYGHYPAAVVFSDILFLLISLLVSIGLIVFAGLYGAKLQSDVSGKSRFWEIGLWHAIMQIATPLCLALYGSHQQIAIITLIVLALTIAMRKYSSTLSPQAAVKPLLVGWLIVGSLTLSIAVWGTAVPIDWGRLIWAPALGALYSCIWFGWYMALTVSLNGHSTEAGGGARSERYRHFIRFKLTRDALTGYVIGIDDPADCIDDQGRFKTDRKLRLVDVFTVKKTE